MKNKTSNPFLTIETQQDILSRAHDALSLGGFLLARTLVKNSELAREYCWLLECDFKRSRAALAELSEADIRDLAVGEALIRNAAERFHDNIRQLHKEVYLAMPEVAAIIQPAVNAIGWYAEALTDFIIKFNSFIDNKNANDYGKD